MTPEDKNFGLAKRIERVHGKENHTPKPADGALKQMQNLENLVEKISEKLVVMDGIDCGYKYACMDVLGYLQDKNSDLIDRADEL